MQRAKEYNKHAKKSRTPRWMSSVPAEPWRTTYWDETMVFRPDGGLAVVQRAIQTETAIHGHAFTEVVIITDGTAMHAIDGTHYSLAPGDFFVVTGKRRHGYYDPKKLRLINVLIRNDFIAAHRAELGKISGGRLLFDGAFSRPRSLAPEELDDCLRLIERLERELAGLHEGSIPMQRALLLELLVTLCRRAEDPAKVEELSQARIGQALSFIDRHYAEEIGLPEMARAAGMSPRSFQRHFKEALDISPFQYLQRRRIANCCRLLSETNDSIQSIASACGISEPAYFCRLFRKMTGSTPGAFRRHRFSRA